jgi:hypothetical protein
MFFTRFLSKCASALERHWTGNKRNRQPGWCARIVQYHQELQVDVLGGLCSVSVACSQSYASRSSLYLAHPGVNAGAPFERNEGDRQAPGYARIVRYHQELHPGSLVAVWVLVRANLWRIACVCGVGARGEDADTQDPLEAVQGRERVSMRMCAAMQVPRVVW